MGRRPVLNEHEFQYWLDDPESSKRIVYYHGHLIQAAAKREDVRALRDAVKRAHALGQVIPSVRRGKDGILEYLATKTWLKVEKNQKG